MVNNCIPRLMECVFRMIIIVILHFSNLWKWGRNKNRKRNGRRCWNWADYSNHVNTRGVDDSSIGIYFVTLAIHLEENDTELSKRACLIVTGGTHEGGRIYTKSIHITDDKTSCNNRFPSSISQCLKISLKGPKPRAFRSRISSLKTLNNRYRSSSSLGRVQPSTVTAQRLGNRNCIDPSVSFRTLCSSVRIRE